MIVLKRDLLPFQQRLYEDRSRFLIALFSRQTGKGHTSSFIATADAMTNKRSNWIIASPTERQSMETLDKCKEWAEKAKIAFADTEEELTDLDGKTKIKAKVIEFELTHSKIYGLPGRPSSLRGFTGSLILDEFAFFEDQAEVWKAVYAVIVNPMRNIKRVIITSTPNGQGDMFHRLCKENLLEPDPSRKLKWSVHKVTIHEAAKEWEAAGKLGGRTAEEYVEEVRAGFDTPEAWPQEFECEFLDTSATVLTLPMISAAESPNADEHGFDPNEPGEFYGGFDFGGIKDPSVFWYAKKVAGVLVTRDVLRLMEPDTGRQLAAVKSRIAKCRRVCVDYTGPGRGFADIAANGLPGTDFGGFGEYDPDPKSFKRGKIEKCLFTAPFKTELFTPFRKLFEEPLAVAIPAAKWIREDLHQLQMVVSGETYRFWSPRTAAGHADGATALALCRRAASFGGVYVPPVISSRRKSYEQRSVDE